MKSRIWAAGAAVWIVAFLVLAYIIFDPQPWYAAIIAAAGVLSLYAAIVGTDGPGRRALLFSLGIMVVAALLGGLKAGPVMLPGIISAALAVRNSAANLEAPTSP